LASQTAISRTLVEGDPDEDGFQLLRMRGRPNIKLSIISFSELVDFNAAWQLTCYTIHSNDDSLDASCMSPDWVLVKEYSVVPRFCVWRGCLEEAISRAELQKSARARKARAKPQKRKAKQKAKPKMRRTKRRAGNRAAIELGANGDSETDARADSDATDAVHCGGDGGGGGDDDMFWPDDDSIPAADELDGPAESEFEGLPEDGCRESDASSVPDDVVDSARGSEPPVPIPAEVVEGAPHASRHKAMKDDALSIAGFGEIRYNMAQENMSAVCKDVRHGKDCRRVRTCHGPSRVNVKNSGQGRPIGILVAWLMEGHRHADCAAHKAAMAEITHEMRVAARLVFSDLPGSAEMASLERSLNPGEANEPANVH
jgi:hypothetical protein